MTHFAAILLLLFNVAQTTTGYRLLVDPEECYKLDDSWLLVPRNSLYHVVYDIHTDTAIFGIGRMSRQDIDFPREAGPPIETLAGVNEFVPSVEAVCHYEGMTDAQMHDKVGGCTSRTVHC